MDRSGALPNHNIFGKWDSFIAIPTLARYQTTKTRCIRAGSNALPAFTNTKSVTKISQRRLRFFSELSWQSYRFKICQVYDVAVDHASSLSILYLVLSFYNGNLSVSVKILEFLDHQSIVFALAPGFIG